MMHEHSASNPDFDPQDYSLRGIFVLNGTGLSPAERSRHGEVVKALKAEGFEFAFHQEEGKCGHCGQRIAYAALLTSQRLREMIYVGETCLHERFRSGLTKRQFHARRKEAAAHRERIRIPARIEALAAEHPGLAELTYPEALRNHSNFVNDIAARFTSTGRLSERQIEAVLKAIATQTAHHAKIEAKEIEQARALGRGDIMLAPSGENLVEGEIKKVYWSSVHAGWNNVVETLRMRVDDERGFSVLGTVPSKVRRAAEQRAADNNCSVEDVLLGRTIVFKANLKPFEDFRAYASRPTQAYLVEG